MLEKQREIMLQRQKEFELKRQQQQQQVPLSKETNPAVASVSVYNNIGGNRTSLNKTPPTGGSSSNIPVAQPKTSAQSNASLTQSPSQPKVNSDAKPAPSPLLKVDQSKSGLEPPSPLPLIKQPESAAPAKAEPMLDGPNPEEIETRARKYTMDPNDLNARRSKNVHDYAMYAKDVTRRPSFNPRPKDSPFTPEMQAAMKVGHEAMMQAELEKKMDKIATEGEQKKDVLPGFEDEEAEQKKAAENVLRKEAVPSMKEEDEVKESADRAKEEGGEGEKKVEETVSVPPKDENFSLDVEEVRKQEEAEKARAEKSNQTDDPNLAKYLPQSNFDRKSKNVHDLGQYFNRRASFVPPPGGEGQQQRRPSFLPQEGAARRQSFLPPPAAGTN